jgi:hypothetical protein
MSSTLRPASIDPRGRRALAGLFRVAAATTALAMLGACGGGAGGDGGDSAAPSSPPMSPAPSPVGPIAAQMTVPAPVGYDPERLAAFDRLNEIRLAAGLGMLAQNAALDQAAQAHADWIVANDSFTHDETAGTVGFTGVHWWERDEALGYVPVEGEELIAGFVHGAQGVDVLVNGVYHRAGLLAFEPVDVGIGWNGAAAARIAMPLVIDLTRPGNDRTRSLGQSAQPSIHGVGIWPLDEAQGVPLRLGAESPNPVPDQPVLTLGTPVSITVDNEASLETVSFVLSNAVTGAVVATRLLTQQNDPNLLIPRSFVALVPLSPLAPGTRYRVVYGGTSTDVLSGSQAVVDRAWAFSTAD